MAETGEIQLGDRVQYRINKFQGIATGITEYLQQCRQVLVVPEKTTADGGHVDGRWIDEPWLDVIEKGVHKPKAAVESGMRARMSGAEDRSHPSSGRRS